MNSDQRRQEILKILENETDPISASNLAKRLGVSRQIIVGDVALLRAQNHIINTTHKGYFIHKEKRVKRIFKVKHNMDEVSKELEAIVDLGGSVEDVFVYHRVYNIIKADLNIHSRRDINQYMSEIESGASTVLLNITNGYHYHTVYADSKEILDEIQSRLEELGLLAKLQDYEPIDFSNN